MALSLLGLRICVNDRYAVWAACRAVARTLARAVARHPNFVSGSFLIEFLAQEGSPNEEKGYHDNLFQPVNDGPNSQLEQWQNWKWQDR